ncbi:hypothetical protein A3H89_02595 [Candidatus Amesbacteria bacterium RIFCSPLOWO2_02_FULL_48_11]|uniref:Uncharacterized protein n=5 Tax=Candidatus Amesiibacteriota TaxID=1752730 RepID=A0A1F4ZBD0_9BACT|nr:MAG: hypothetical protein UX78_C0015G0025 [Candidatus Amesbacteria bacterium GW2011_GWA2_47_11]KKU90690.1 MAG: hypothetical protein UY22_C0051G0012 [Candidatus Amesbacteria bacterium GW2011_GWC1_48_10]KKU99709.1 MAG: hypothetical protein UY33_C0024G0014 [Candidatus Amesbacteria bacterium GW2011_GWA1_48_9]OGC89899.1 MAG: hypothetical protein A2V48_01700 [Candidatus Amesbacteria bacterium RBG_19FT_COMBO_48_16]OGC95664.1 MAG: hypothetical protein A3C34_02320 [Candidatus Amesbacteria bacterium R
MSRLSPVPAAALAAVGMLSFYLLTLRLLSGSLSFTLSQFRSFWWLVLPITATFAAQVYLIRLIKLRSALPSATGATSALSMAACCAHHVAEFLPFLGLFTAASFAIRYQVPIMSLALFLNLLGLTYLFHTLKV